MATGDKIYIADKETLDAVKENTDTMNTNTSDTKKSVGATGDTGGSATSGSIFAKLNAIISHLLSNWSAARGALIDTINTNAATASAQATNANTNAYNASVQTATNNSANASGTLSQKLSYIINQVSNLLNGLGQKKLTSKCISTTVSSAGTHTLLNLSGGGVFHGCYTAMGGPNAPLTFIIDGQEIVLNAVSSSNYIAGTIQSGGINKLLYQYAAGSISTNSYAAFRPVYFKDTFVVKVTTTTATSWLFEANYAVYE